MKIFRHIKTTLIGLAMLSYGYYKFESLDAIEKYSFDFWFIACSSVLGFILLFTGDRFINRIIEALLNRVYNKKKL